MGALSTVILPDILRSIDSATFTGTYQPVGTPLIYPTRLIRFLNTSNVGVTVSWDGINAADYLPANSFLLLDISTNHENSLVFEIQIGTQFYVMGSTGTGLFYISTYYGR